MQVFFRFLKGVVNSLFTKPRLPYFQYCSFDHRLLHAGVQPQQKSIFFRKFIHETSGVSCGFPFTLLRMKIFLSSYALVACSAMVSASPLHRYLFHLGVNSVSSDYPSGIGMA